MNQTEIRNLNYKYKDINISSTKDIKNIQLYLRKLFILLKINYFE